MKIKNSATTFISFLLALSFFSCKEQIDISVPSGEKKLAVEAEVTTETDSSYVKLTLSSDYFSTDPYPTVNDASVSVNGISFVPAGNGMYRPASPFTGVRNQLYNLKIVHDGKTYTSQAILEPMFRVDSIFQVFKPREGFQRPGFAINYTGFDDRPKIKYTYFRFGYFDTLVHRDSFDNNKILFDNDLTPLDSSFELPFTRFQVGDECLMIFRSVDRNMYNFIGAYNEQTSGAPGPFQAPPANLPTNITGGAIGYFATYDVVRKRYTVK